MADYAAPVRDMQFVINEMIGSDRLAGLPGCEDVSDDLTNAVLEEAAKLAGEVLSPLNRVGDLEGARLDGDVVHTPSGWREAYTAFCEGGWTSLAMSPEFGGQGLPKVIATAVSEMWDGANMAFALCPLLTNGAIEAIEQHGDDDLRAKYLEKLVSGEWAGTMNLTEPQAGSDLSKVRSKAVPEGDHYLISGQKIFITYGEHDLTSNIIHLVLARTPDAPEGTRGISLFVVPKFLLDDNGETAERNDLRCVSLEHKLGIHASPTAVMSYGDNGGAVGYLVGEENRGLMYMFTMMNAARHAVGREGVAVSEASYQLALSHALDRVQGQAPGAEEGTPIIAHADVKRMLMTMKSHIEAMRALTLVCALAYDEAERHQDPEQRARANRRGDLLTPVVKGWCTETAQTVTWLGTQVHGGMGFVEETGAAQFQRDARILTIYEGTTGIQAADFVGRKTLRDGGAAMGELLEDMLLTVAAVEAAGGELAEMGKKLAGAAGELRRVVDWLLATADDPTIAGAASAHYLKLAGIVCGAWMLTEGARLSATALTNDEVDKPFYTAKMACARFFLAQVLPETAALAEAIVEGSQTTTAIEAAHFEPA